jgi:predicted HicB family RNase H-like nuclease
MKPATMRKASIQVSRLVKALAITNAKAQGISVKDYVERLIEQDKPPESDTDGQIKNHDTNCHI